MVDTSVQAELQNCIRQAQDQLIQMGPIIAQVRNRFPEANRLEEMNVKAGKLLREAQERCEELM